MAVIYLCDICNEPTVSQTTRRWSPIYGKYGLEVVILTDDQPVGDTHLCNDCIVNILWGSLEKQKLKNSPLEKLRKEIKDREYKCDLKEREVLEQARKNDSKSKELELFEDKLEQKKKSLAERETKVVAAEVYMTTFQNAVRQAEARGYQKAIDEREYPEAAEITYKRNLRIEKK